MNQTEWDNQEEEFTLEDERHEAIADAIMANIIANFQDDATEVMKILSDHIKKMAEGDQDGECLIAVIDGAICAPFNKRHDPCNRWIIDAIYSKSLDMARN